MTTRNPEVRDQGSEVGRRQVVSCKLLNVGCGRLTLKSLKTLKRTNSLVKIEKYGSGYLRVRNEIAEYATMTFDYRESGDGYLAQLEYREQRIETVTKVGERGQRFSLFWEESLFAK
jgi:hypothetical protein